MTVPPLTVTNLADARELKAAGLRPHALPRQLNQRTARPSP
jgi:hypothetical protein